MNNCEPCQPCEPVPCVQFNPPEIIIPCVNGEPCSEITDAKCVQYNGANLINIDVTTNDRLDVILSKININHQSSGLIIEDTDSIDISGTGISSDPLQAILNIDPVIDNLIITTVTGVKVQFTKENILSLFQKIDGDVDLQAAFCLLVSNCADNVCGIPTGVTATII